MLDASLGVGDGDSDAEFEHMSDSTLNIDPKALGCFR
jgi:hypothetical protein